MTNPRIPTIYRSGEEKETDSSNVFTDRLLSILTWIKYRSSRGAVYSSASITGLLLATGGHPSLTLLFTVMIASYSSALATYTLNDAVDVEVDRINAPDRSAITRRLRRSDIICVVVILFLIGLSLSYAIGLQAFSVSLAGCIIGILYSAPAVSIKDRFLAKTLCIGAGGVLASLFGSLSAGCLSPSVLLAASLFFIFLFVTSPVNDLADFTGDKLNGRRTIPIVIGPRRTVMLALVVSLVPAVITLSTFSTLNLSFLTPLLATAVSISSIILVWPLRHKYDDARYVRRRHKKMVPLHLLLQASLALGAL